eukprot:c11875_g2_i1.p1 GENE.c11875_g2_i1~~c11875_g2_i1.p1  ORF type:complete len:556 (-),score=67.78 c11875_g2_i1:92-1759(-)
MSVDSANDKFSNDLQALLPIGPDYLVSTPTPTTSTSTSFVTTPTKKYSLVGNPAHRGSLSVSPCPPITFLIPPPKRTLDAFGLISLGFFWVSGGVYGNEALVLASPPLYMNILITAGALMYALPISLITAELATGWPVKEGMSGWTQIAFGRDWGAQSRWWIFSCYLFDAGIYPVLASEYLHKYAPSLSFLHCKIYGLGLIVLTTMVKLCGRDWIVRFSSVLAFFSLAPLMIYFAFGLRYLNPSLFFSTAGAPLNLPLAMSYVLWMFSGFFSLGSIAGEVKTPRRSYSIAVAILLPLVFALNTLCLLTSISIDSNRDNFQPGHFDLLAEKILGNWMKHVFFLGSQISLIGLYNSCSITCECALVPYLKPHMARLRRNSPWLKDSVLGHFLTDHRTTGVARIYILLVMLICCALVWLPYDFLVEFSMLMMAVIIMPFLASFLYLRLKQPDKERAFRVPGNFLVALIISLMPFALTCGYIYIALEQSGSVLIYGIPYLNVVGLGGIIGMGAFSWFVGWVHSWRRQRRFVVEGNLPKSPLVINTQARSRYLVDGRPAN